MDRTAKLIDVGGSIVSKPRKFCVIPHSLIGIQLGSIGRKAMSPHRTVTAQIVPHEAGFVVDVDPIPDNAQGALNLAAKESKKLNDVLRSGISVVFKKSKVKSHALPLWAERDGADGRNPVVTIPAFLDRRLPTRCKGAAHEWCEHESGFVEKD